MKICFSNWHGTLVSVFSLAILTRCVFVLTQQNGFYFPDSLLYSRVAVNLVSTGQFGADFGLSPGYPVFLAGVYSLFGENIFAIRVVESVMGAFLAVIMAAVGKRTGGEIVGAVAGIIWAVYPMGVFVAGLVYPTGLAAMLLACGVFFVLPSSKHEELAARKLFLGGILLGLAALTIPVALLTIVGVAAWVLYWGRGARLFLASMFLIGAAVSLAPWTARNFLVLGRLIPVQPNFEQHLRKAIVLTSDGKRVTVETDVRKVRPGVTLSGLELYTFRFRRNFIKFWELYPTSIAMDEQGYRESLHAQDARIVEETIYRPNHLINTVSILSTGPVFLFALLGTIAMWQRKELRRDLSILWIMAMSFAVGYAFFWGKMRYRIPVEPYPIILSAYGLHAAYAIISMRFKSVTVSGARLLVRDRTANTR